MKLFGHLSTKMSKILLHFPTYRILFHALA